MQTKIVFLLIISFGVLASCNGRKGSPDSLSLDNCPVVAERAGDLIVCKYELATDTFDLPLSALASGLEVIRLDNENDDALVKEGRVDVSENYAGVFSSGSYKLFDRQGCGNKALDEEAVRLVKEIKYTPGTDLKGKPIRCGDMKIMIEFPPREPDNNI